MWDIIGHSKVVALLQRSLEQKNLAHAYLLVGPPHVGKMTLALTLAAALNCRSAQPPCGECEACKKAASGKHADVQIVGLLQNGTAEDPKAKTEIGIEQVRQLLHSCNLPPFEGDYKVYIIDEAERMSNESANCLLKTLEEPVGNVVFILLTENDKLLLPTVISRCQRLELARLTIAEVETALSRRWNVEPENAKLLARLCQGCLGWALLTLSDAALLQQRGEKMEKLLEVVRSGYAERFDYASQLATQFGRKRDAAYEELDIWLGWWRDVLLVKTGCTESVINIDYIQVITEMAQSCALEQIKSAIRSIQSASHRLKINAGARLVLDVLMLDIPRVSSAKIEVKHA